MAVFLIEGLDGWRRMAFETIGSTNTEAMRLGLEGDPGQLWITADAQSDGKARRGRNWVSKAGNLYASVLLVDPAPQEMLVSLPLLASLALHNALVSVAPQIAGRLKIKWPNDLLLDGKKLSGILLEASPNPASGQLAVTIGFGVNCQHFPENPLYPATSLASSGVDVTPSQVFSALSRQLAAALEIWQRGKGIVQVREDWLKQASGLGENITARFPDHEINGKFVDVDLDGFLLLEDKEMKIHKISAADIFLGKPLPKGHKAI